MLLRVHHPPRVDHRPGPRRRATPPRRWRERAAAACSPSTAPEPYIVHAHAHRLPQAVAEVRRTNASGKLSQMWSCRNTQCEILQPAHVLILSTGPSRGPPTIKFCKAAVAQLAARRRARAKFGVKQRLLRLLSLPTSRLPILVIIIGSIARNW